MKNAEPQLISSAFYFLFAEEVIQQVDILIRRVTHERNIIVSFIVNGHHAAENVFLVYGIYAEHIAFSVFLVRKRFHLSVRNPY